MARPEKLIIENKTLADIFNKEFLTNIEKISTDIFPVTIVFVKEYKKDNNTVAYPIIISHQNQKEVKKKVMHIECPNTELLNSFVKIIEKSEKK